MYSVVKFLDGEESYSEVPSIWLDDGNNCWWPKSKSVSSLITKMVAPNKTDGRWTLYPVRVQKTTDDYELARKFADNYEASGDEKGRGFRKKMIKSHKFQESDSSDCELDKICKEHLDLPNYPASKPSQRKSQVCPTQDLCPVSANGKNSDRKNSISAGLKVNGQSSSDSSNFSPNNGQNLSDSLSFSSNNLSKNPCSGLKVNGQHSTNSSSFSPNNVSKNTSSGLKVNGQDSTKSLSFLSNNVSKNTSSGLKVNGERDSLNGQNYRMDSSKFSSVESSSASLESMEFDPFLIPEVDETTLVAEATNVGDEVEINQVDLSLVQVSTDRLILELKAHVDEQFKKTQRMVANVQATLERLMATRGEAQSILSEDDGGLREKALDLKSMFPIKCLDNLKEVDKKIEEDRELFNLLVRQLKLIGGSTLKDKIIRIMKKTFTNEVIAKASWLGHSRGETVNFKLSSLKLIYAIREAIEDDPEFSEKKFEGVCSDWVRQGKQRFKREGGKQNVMDETREETPNDEM